MVDLKGQYNNIKTEVDLAIQQVIDTTAFINGAVVSEFTRNLEFYLGAAQVVSCANGTDALQIALMALGLKTGDEVVVPVHTYVATAEVIALLGLKPVFVDVYPETFTIDVSQIESVITPHTKAIVPVHLYGQGADMESIMRLANKHKLYVVEDTAQAIGADYTFSDGTTKKLGTIGDVGTTSFFPSKNLGCYGDGGAMMFNDLDLAKKAKRIANHGQSQKYVHDIVGCNSRLDSLQAAILNVKLKQLDKYTQSRQKAADYYDTELRNVNGIAIPKRESQSTHVFHQYTLKVSPEIERDWLKEQLLHKGIPSMIYYPIPLHKQKAYASHIAFPVTETLSKEVLSLPIHTEMKKEELDYICTTIKDLIYAR